MILSFFEGFVNRYLNRSRKIELFFFLIFVWQNTHLTLTGTSKTKDVSAALFQKSAKKLEHKKLKKIPLHIKYEYDVSREKADRGILNHLTKQRKVKLKNL